MRKKDDALHERLLDAARAIAETEGVDAVNIRSLAGKTGIAAGTVYNYFSSKDDLLLALTEEYWRQALLQLPPADRGASFCAQVEQIFFFLQERIDQSAGPLMASLGNVEADGQRRMRSMQAGLEAELVQRLERDPHIRRELWSESFSPELFARFVVLNLIALLRTHASNPDFLNEIIRRSIY